MSYRTTVRIVGGKFVDHGVYSSGEAVFEFVSDDYPFESEVIRRFENSDWAEAYSRALNTDYHFTWESAIIVDPTVRHFTLRKVEKVTQYWTEPGERQ